MVSQKTPGNLIAADSAIIESQATIEEHFSAQILQGAEALTIADDQSLADSDTLVRQIAKLEAKLEASKKKLTKPTWDLLEAQRDFFRTSAKNYKEARETIRGKISAYLADKEERRLAAIEASQLASQAGDLAQAQAAYAEIVQVTVDKPEKMSTRFSWTFEIVDESALPEWCWKRVPDLGKISAALAVYPTDQKTPEVPGLLIKREASFRLKG